MLLGWATLVFMGVTISAYQVIRLINRLSAETIEILTGMGADDVQDATDNETLISAYHVHQDAGGWITAGVELLVMVMLCVGLMVHVLAMVAVLAGVGLILRLLPTLRGLLF